MNPNDAEAIHEARRNLAALAREHGWQATMPFSGWDRVWLELHRKQDGARLDIMWADLLPTGCQIEATSGLTRVTRNVQGASTIRLMVKLDPWGFRTAVELAAHIDAPIIDLTDGGTT